MDDKSPIRISHMPDWNDTRSRLPSSEAWSSKQSLWGSIRRFLIGFLIVAVTFTALWPLVPRRFEATASIILRPTDANGRIDRGQSLRQPLDENAVQSEMDIMGSPAFAAIVTAKHNLAVDPEFGGGLRDKLSKLARRTFPALFGGSVVQDQPTEAQLRQRLQDHLTVSRDRRSYTVKLGYWSSDPNKAAAMTQTLLDAYLDDQLQRKHSAVESFAEQVTTLRARYENTEDSIQQLESQPDLIDASMRASLESRLSTLNKEAADVRKQVIDATARIRVLTDMQNAGVFGPPRTPMPVTDDKTKPGNVGRSPGNPAEADLAIRDEAARMKDWIYQESVLRNAIKILREDLAKGERAQSRLDDLHHEASMDKELLGQAVMRMKEQATRVDTDGPGVEILATPEVPQHASFPNPVLAALGTLVAACSAGAAMVCLPLRKRPAPYRATASS